MREAILEALENLTPDELKKFKLMLLSVPLREGYGRIPRGSLLSMDAVDLTDKLVNSYLEEYAAELTALALRNMGMQATAERLQTKQISERAPSTPSRIPYVLQDPLTYTQPPTRTVAPWALSLPVPPTLSNKSSSCWEGSLPALVLTDQRAPDPKFTIEKGRGPFISSLQALQPCQPGPTPLAQWKPRQVRPSHPNSLPGHLSSPTPPQPCTACLSPQPGAPEER